MQKAYLINRSVYKNIKKYDHQQMERFLKSIYDSGYKDGGKDAEGLTDEEVKKVILTVKGIGEKKAEAIMLALKEAMRKGEDDEREKSVPGDPELHG